MEPRKGPYLVGDVQQSGEQPVADRRAAVIDETRALIDRYGWSVVGVFPASESDGVPFAYTVGLTGKQLPELAIYGLGGRVAQEILNAVARRMVDGGRPLIRGERIAGVLAGGVDLAAVEMTSRIHDLAMVGQVYGSVDAAVQLCWPDADGLFPWEPGSGVDDDVQPVCGDSPSGRAVYRAGRLRVENVQELADLAAGAPRGALTFVDPQADNDCRARWGAQALIAYATNQGKASLQEELETAASDMLADLRHLFDALDLDWEALSAKADANYRAEIIGEI